LRLAAEHDEVSFRQLLFGFGNQGPDISEHSAQIAAVGAGQDVDYRHDVVMVDDRRTGGSPQRGQVGKHLGVAPSRLADPRGDDIQGGEGIHGMLRRADVDEVLDALLGVEPVHGLHLAAAAEAQQHRIGHVALGQAKLRGLDAVDGELEPRQVGRLLHPHVGHAGDAAKFLGQPAGNGTVLLLIAADDLDVERRRQTEIDGLTHDVGGQKVESDSGKSAVQPESQAADILLGGPMPRAGERP